MAEIIPFRGILYNTHKINNMANVVAPPFDIISEREQLEYHERHPHNIIRLTLGKTHEDDTSINNRYTRAADCFNKWLSDHIMKRDKSPAFYFTSMEFLYENRVVTRYGLIVLVGLEPFEKGVVLPHEKTFPNVKSERLELMKACHANFSPIFSLYSDNENRVLDELKNATFNKTADNVFTDNNGQKHFLWRITDKSIHRHVSEAFKDKLIFIADGHHRYETALNYRDWLSANRPTFSGDHPANYVMMYLCSMEDPGLIILPAHRLLNQVPVTTRLSLIKKAGTYFDIITIPYKNGQQAEARNQFMSILSTNNLKNCIGVFMKDRRELYVLTLKPGVMDQMFTDELPEVIRNIDVTVLSRLIFMEIFGFDQCRHDNEKLIAYSSIAKDAIDAVDTGKHDIAFIMNPTKIQQVRNIAEAGLIMPRKATYFFPKVIAGQVLNKLD
ncbi:MAG: DUF1015 domain-containing protein [Desulfobacterales bacterium]